MAMEMGIPAELDAEALCADGALGIREALEFTRLGRSELYERMAAGSLPYVKVGRRRLIPKRALVRLLAEGLQA